MLPVSEQYKQAISGDLLQTTAKVVIDWSGANVDTSIQVCMNDQADISYPLQAADGIEDPTYKWASLDGSWILDGTWYLAPANDEEAKYQEFGVWSDSLADDDGNFKQQSGTLCGSFVAGKRILSSPSWCPTMTVTFLPRPIRTIKPCFDSLRGEYAVDFDIQLFSGGTLLHTESVTGNTSTKWLKTLSDTYLNVDRMTLIIKKWSHPRQAKIYEFVTSLQRTYTGDDLIDLHLLEEREFDSGTLPVGNISSNELDLRLDNTDDQFTPGNQASPVSGLVMRNRQIRPYIGVVKSDGLTEWVPLGVFFSDEWDIPEDEPYASTTARDRLDGLASSKYTNSKVIMNPADTSRTDATDSDWQQGSHSFTSVSNSTLTFNIRR